MSISTDSWRWLRDFTRDCLGLETPSGDLTAYFFRDLRDALRAKTSSDEELEEAFLHLASKVEKQDQELFLEGFKDLERKITALEARRPPSLNQIISDRLKKKPLRAEEPLRARIRDVLATS